MTPKRLQDYYKYDELKSYFDSFIEEQIHHGGTEWIAGNIDDLHHIAFNEDYYIIVRWKAQEWLCSPDMEVFNIINQIVEYEKFNFGEVFTDVSDPEKIVNMYAYIIGEMIVSEFRDLFQYEHVA